MVVRVRSAERVSDGVLITFDDGQCGFFSDELMRATLAQAQVIDEALIDW